MAAAGTARRRVPFRGRRAEERRKRRGILRGIIWGALLLGILAGIWYGTRLPFVSLSAVVVSGGETIDHEAVAGAVEEALSGTYVLLVPKRFSYTYPHDRVADAVANVARVKEVDVRRTSRTELAVAVSEYLPHALWCPSLDEPAGCVFLDEEGYAFAHAPNLRGALFLRYAREGVTPAEDVQFSGEARMQADREFVRALSQEHNLRIYAVREQAVGDRRYLVRGGGEILVAGDANIQEVYENLTSVLASEEFAHLAPGNFEYVDLRFGSQVFVKEVEGLQGEDL